MASQVKMSRWAIKRTFNILEAKKQNKIKHISEVTGMIQGLSSQSFQTTTFAIRELSAGLLTPFIFTKNKNKPLSFLVW